MVWFKQLRVGMELSASGGSRLSRHYRSWVHFSSLLFLLLLNVSAVFQDRSWLDVLLMHTDRDILGPDLLCLPLLIGPEHYLLQSFKVGVRLHARELHTLLVHPTQVNAGIALHVRVNADVEIHTLVFQGRG